MSEQELLDAILKAKEERREELSLRDRDIAQLPKEISLLKRYFWLRTMFYYLIQL